MTELENMIVAARSMGMEESYIKRIEQTVQALEVEGLKADIVHAMAYSLFVHGYNLGAKEAKRLLLDNPVHKE